MLCHAADIHTYMYVCMFVVLLACLNGDGLTKFQFLVVGILPSGQYILEEIRSWTTVGEE